MTTSKTDDTTLERGPLKLLGAAILLILLTWGTCFWILFQISVPIATTGQFGDSFGVLNTLYSGMAFALLIFTAFIQFTELKEQRKEVKMMRVESTEQTRQFRLQTEILTKQLQAAELRSRSEAVKERAASLPVMVAQMASYNRTINDALRVDLRISNTGADVFNIRVLLSDGILHDNSKRHDVWVTGTKIPVDFTVTKPSAAAGIRFWVRYETSLEEVLFDVFEFKRLESGGRVYQIGRRAQPLATLPETIRDGLA